MGTKTQIFVDTDVVISSLISSTGAAFSLINEFDIVRYYSDYTTKELERTIAKLDLDIKQANSLLKRQFKPVQLDPDPQKVQSRFGQYVFDPLDAHVVAGAHKSHSPILVTFNIRHFQLDKIKQELEILIQNPSQFVQSLRNS